MTAIDCRGAGVRGWVAYSVSLRQIPGRDGNLWFLPRAEEE